MSIYISFTIIEASRKKKKTMIRLPRLLIRVASSSLFILQQQQQQRQWHQRELKKEQAQVQEQVQQVLEKKIEVKKQVEVEKQEQWKKESQKKLQQLNIPAIRYMVAIDASGSSCLLHLRKTWSNYEPYVSSNPSDAAGYFPKHWTYARMIDLLGQILEKEKVADFSACAFGAKDHHLEWICHRKTWYNTFRTCSNFETFLKRYVKKGVKISANYSWGCTTSCLGAIQAAVDACLEDKQYTVLFIITDGEMRGLDMVESIHLIDQHLPLSIIFIQVQDSAFYDFERHVITHPFTVGFLNFQQFNQPEILAKEVSSIITLHYQRVIKKLNSIQSVEWRNFDSVRNQIKRENCSP
jgi:hypothetical protein